MYPMIVSFTHKQTLPAGVALPKPRTFADADDSGLPEGGFPS
jgi:hypothetical protein